ncbi:MAG: AAA family ATPase [Bacteroidota bacterium]|nr:AAA family ATPase [Bacteroidota bacterium]
MAHLTRFGLKNFRIFEEYTDFEFAPITVFTGTNSSGKSSVLKALQLLKHNFDENLKSRLRKYDWNIEDLDFSGNNHQLGNFLTTKNNNNKFREISFSMPFVFTNIIEEGRIEFTYQLDDESEIKNGKLNQLVIQFKLEGKYSDVIKLKLEKERYKKNPKISNDYGPKEGTTIHYWKVEIDFNFFREKLDFIVEGFRKLNKKKYIKEGDYYMLPDKNLNLYLKNDVTWWRLPEDNHRNEDYIKYSGFAEYFQKNLDTHLLPWHGILTENHIVVDFNYEGNKPFYDFNSSTYDHLKTPLYKIYQEVIKSSKNQKNNKKRLIQEEREFLKNCDSKNVIPYPDYLTLGNPVIAFKNYISQLDRFINKMYFEPEAGIEEFTFLDWKRASYFLYDFLTEEFLHSLERTLSSFRISLICMQKEELFKDYTHTLLIPTTSISFCEILRSFQSMIEILSCFFKSKS